MVSRVSVVIPTFDAGKDFPEVLAAVLAQDVDGKLEVVVVDSGSTDGTAELLRRQPVRLLEIPSREFDHGLTRNLGVREASGDFVAMLTQDARPADSSWLRRLVECFGKDPRVAGAYSRQLPRPDANPFIRFRLERWAAAEPEPRVQEIASRQAFEALAPLERLRSAAFDNVSSCLRRTVALAIPFRRRAFGEDLDWSLRAMRAGHRIVYEPRSQVIHSHQRSTWYELKRVYRDHQCLHELLGVHTVRRRRDVFHATAALVPDLCAAVRADPRLGRLERWAWYAKSLPFGFTQNLGQLLGARSVAALAAGSPFYRVLDRLLGDV